MHPAKAPMSFGLCRAAGHGNAASPLLRKTGIS